MGVVASKIKEGVDDVGDFVKHGAEAVGHVAQAVGGEALNLAHDADHVVTTVGNTVAGVVSHIPVVGGDLSKGIYGATDLVHKEFQKGEAIGNAVVHPIDAINSALDTVEHPDKLLDFGKGVLNNVQETAGDVGNVIGAVKVVAPEFAPELSAIQAGADLVAHPSLNGALSAVEDIAPDSAEAKRVLAVAKKAIKIGKAGYKTFDAVKHFASNPTIGGALSALSTVAPKGSMFSKGLKVANAANTFSKHPTIAGALAAAQKFAPKGGGFASALALAKRGTNIYKASDKFIKNPSIGGAMNAAQSIVPKGSKLAKTLGVVSNGIKTAGKIHSLIQNPSLENALSIGKTAVQIARQIHPSHPVAKKHLEHSIKTKKHERIKQKKVRSKHAHADGAFGSEEYIRPVGVIVRSPEEYHEMMHAEYGSLMHHLFKHGNWIGSISVNDDDLIDGIYYPIRE